MGTASPTTAIQKKVDVSVDDGQSKGDKVYFLEIWSIGSAPGDKTVELMMERNLMVLLGKSSLNLIKIIIIFIQRLTIIKRTSTNNKAVLLRDLLYQDYLPVTQKRLLEQPRPTTKAICLSYIMAKQKV